MTAVRAVLFDFGNTLFGHASLASTIERCAARLGRAIEPTDAAALAAEIDEAAHTEAELLLGRDLDGRVWDERWRLLYGTADRWASGLGAAVMADMHDPTRWVPFRDTIATVSHLAAAGVAIGVVSNTGWDVRTVFRHHGIHDHIASYALSYEVGWVKPAPEIFAAACAALGAEPASSLMVGDDPRADVGAATSGLRVLLLPVVASGADNGIDAVTGLAGVSGPAAG